VVDLSTLALWTVVETRWPYLADHLRMHPEHVDPQVTGVPDTVAELLATEEVSAVVTTSGWGPLTADQVRRCTGSLT
jgi:hypothetical protein